MPKKYFWREFSSTALNDASPAKVVGQVAGSNAVKVPNPLFEARIVSIDVLDVKHLLPDVLTGRHLDGFVHQVVTLSRGSVDASPIAAQQGIRCQHLGQEATDRR